MMKKLLNLNNINVRYILFGLLLATLPFLSELGLIKFSSLSLFALIVIYTVAAIGLNLLLGFSGLISLATAGFMGFGAYVMVLISNGLHVGFFLAALITIIISGILGAIIGVFSLKVEGIYLAIATLFFGEIFLQIFKQVTWFSGGFSGQKFHYPLVGVGNMLYLFDRNTTFLLLVAILVLMMILANNIVKSKTGRALMAMSRSEHAAQAMGISILKYRVLAFVISTMYASLAGVLYVSFFKFVEPVGWNLNLSLFFIAMVVVGGFKSIFGTFIGTFVIYGIPNFILKDLFQNANGFSYVFSGVLIILVIMYYPNGTYYIWYDLKKLLKKTKLFEGRKS